mmetsp:Transcript_89775/g.290518  ORF Transcript_89775/g.290518 Transcript_89775/m.290518 type:complete len:317 (+) Transcript_89775:1124-2074(+)
MIRRTGTMQRSMVCAVVFSLWSSHTEAMTTLMTNGGTAARRSMMLWALCRKTHVLGEEQNRKSTSTVKMQSKAISIPIATESRMAGGRTVCSAVMMMVAMMKGVQVLANNMAAMLESGSSRNLQILLLVLSIGPLRNRKGKYEVNVPVLLHRLRMLRAPLCLMTAEMPAAALGCVSASVSSAVPVLRQQAETCASSVSAAPGMAAALLALRGVTEPASLTQACGRGSAGGAGSCRCGDLAGLERLRCTSRGSCRCCCRSSSSLASTCEKPERTVSLRPSMSSCKCVSRLHAVSCLWLSTARRLAAQVVLLSRQLMP